MNISNQDLKKKNDQIPPCSGEGPPAGFPLGRFSPRAIPSIGRGRTGQDRLTQLSPMQNRLDSTLSEVTKQAWPVLCSEETTKWRSEISTMAILLGSAAQQKWVRRAKQLRTRSSHSHDSLSGGSHFRGAESGAAGYVPYSIRSTAGSWSTSFSSIFSERYPAQMLWGRFMYKMH